VIEIASAIRKGNVGNVEQHINYRACMIQLIVNRFQPTEGFLHRFHFLLKIGERFSYSCHKVLLVRSRLLSVEQVHSA
jgi:hypothetical protein